MAVDHKGKGVVYMSAQGDSLSGVKRWTYYRWVGATTAGHVLVANDTAGDLIWRAEADGANFNDIHPVFKRRDGVVISSMSSGYVLAYYD